MSVDMTSVNATDTAFLLGELKKVGLKLRSTVSGKPFHAVVSVDVPPWALDLLTLPLSSEERQRALRYRRRMDCNRSVVGWITLRSIVAAMRDCKPEDVDVQRESRGKPWVRAGPGVSISHAAALVLVAFSSEAHVGVDIEPVEQDEDVLELIAATLSPSEYIRFSQKTRPARDFLLRAWVRKEAVVKVFGAGLALDPMTLSAADQTGRRFRCRLPGGDMVTGVDLTTRPGHVAALASGSHIDAVIRYHVGSS